MLLEDLGGEHHQFRVEGVISQAQRQRLAPRHKRRASAPARPPGPCRAAPRPVACRRHRADCGARRSARPARSGVSRMPTAASIAATAVARCFFVGRGARLRTAWRAMRLRVLLERPQRHGTRAGHRSRCRSSAPPSAASPARHRPRPGPPAIRGNRGSDCGGGPGSARRAEPAGRHDHGSSPTCAASRICSASGHRLGQRGQGAWAAAGRCSAASSTSRQSGSP